MRRFIDLSPRSAAITACAILWIAASLPGEASAQAKRAATCAWTVPATGITPTRFVVEIEQRIANAGDDVIYLTYQRESTTTELPVELDWGYLYRFRVKAFAGAAESGWSVWSGDLDADSTLGSHIDQ